MPWTVVAAGILVALEGALGLGAAVVFAVRAALGKIEPATSGYGTAGWFAVLGGAVLAAGLALTRGKRWGRAIAVLTELLLLPVVWSLLTDSAQPVLGALVGVVAVAGLALLFAAPTTRWAAAGYAADTE
ncbi:MAG: hypothetical protein HOQ24_01890 [Mycobacteriaceae bacterium]|nr:hypothetical protein [Mycobacteriaceae bacterium]